MSTDVEKGKVAPTKKSIFRLENIIIMGLISSILYLGAEQIRIKESRAKNSTVLKHAAEVAKSVENLAPKVVRLDMKVDGVLCMLQYESSDIAAKAACLQQVINGDNDDYSLASTD